MVLWSAGVTPEGFVSLCCGMDASLSGLQRHVDVAAILEVAAQPLELIQVNGVNFLKLLLQSAISYCLLFTHSHTDEYL